MEACRLDLASRLSSSDAPSPSRRHGPRASPDEHFRAGHGGESDEPSMSGESSRMIHGVSWSPGVSCCHLTWCSPDAQPHGCIDLTWIPATQSKSWSPKAPESVHAPG